MKKVIHNLKKSVKQLKQNTTALYYASKSDATPVIAKVIAAIALGYLLSPIDLIPDFIPVLGMLDELILLPLLILLAIRFIPPLVWQQSKLRAENDPITLSKKNWPFAAFVILIWITTIVITYKAFAKT